MKITLLASFLVMAAYFLLLYAGVGLIQEKKFFSSAPREVFAAVPERKAERFHGAHILGWYLGILAMLLCHSNFFPHFTPRSRASSPRSCSGTIKKRILRTFCSTSPSPPPSRGFARFFEVQFHIKI